MLQKILTTTELNKARKYRLKLLEEENEMLRIRTVQLREMIEC